MLDFPATGPKIDSIRWRSLGMSDRESRSWNYQKFSDEISRESGSADSAATGGHNGPRLQSPGSMETERPGCL